MGLAETRWQAAFIFLSPLFVRADSPAVPPPGTASAVNMIQAEDWLLMLIISVTRVDFWAPLWLLP